MITASPSRLSSQQNKTSANTKGKGKTYKSVLVEETSYRVGGGGRVWERVPRPALPLPPPRPEFPQPPISAQQNNPANTEGKDSQECSGRRNFLLSWRW